MSVTSAINLKNAHHYSSEYVLIIWGLHVHLQYILSVTLRFFLIQFSLTLTVDLSTPELKVYFFNTMLQMQKSHLQMNKTVTNLYYHIIPNRQEAHLKSWE